MVGNRIPYGKFGVSDFAGLLRLPYVRDNFTQSLSVGGRFISHVTHLQVTTGGWVRAKADDKVAHIADMVSNQKTSKSRSGRGGFSGRGGGARMAPHGFQSLSMPTRPSVIQSMPVCCIFTRRS